MLQAGSKTIFRQMQRVQVRVQQDGAPHLGRVEPAADVAQKPPHLIRARPLDPC